MADNRLALFLGLSLTLFPTTEFITARLKSAEHEFPLPTNSLSTSKLTTGGNQQW
jgi:hypothetical protein